MKRATSFLSLMAAAIVGLLQPVFSQTAKEAFSGSPITYLGIDFTQARLINDAGASGTDLKEKHFPGINQVVINEPKKYDLEKAFKTTVTSDISVTEKANATIDADKIKSSSSSDESRLTAADIQNAVNQYDLGGKKGIGLVFIMEGLNKPGAKGSMYVTFIDMASKKVLFTERMVGKAGGFGYKNYWAKSVYEVLEDIQKSKYKEWKNKNA
ncbi:MAG TPA: hypothetical protein VKA49_11300 [Flavitalea sp.]|nr:hypothetical protein [Flavitalea sp.]